MSDDRICWIFITVIILNVLVITLIAVLHGAV